MSGDDDYYFFYDDEHEDVDVDDEALRTKYIAI